MQIDEINEATQTAYLMYKTMVLEALGHEDLTGTCAFGCKFMKSILDRFFNLSVIIRGGDGSEDGGFIDPEGNKHGHYWLEVSTPEQAYIIDITVKQFGDDLPMVMLLEGNKQYLNGNQTLVDQHISELMSGI